MTGRTGPGAAIGLTVGMLVGLPLLGVILAGKPAGGYLSFPPLTRYVRHAPFSWYVFIPLALVIAAAVAPVAVRAFQAWCRGRIEKRRGQGRSFPWWGWCGLGIGAAGWMLAWTRLDWMAALQPHTFTPLWIAYIIVINAVSQRSAGRCLMCSRPVYFLLLFPLSAAFWWFFEYLNRFVQNWYYVGPGLTPWSYFWYATLPFATVLPAVLSTCEWLRNAAWVRRGFTNLPQLSPSRPRRLAAGALLTAAAGLFFIGVWPNALFPLLWLAPLLIVVSIQTLLGQRHLLSEIAAGDWRRAVAAAAAALICGGFWEMWNACSLAKWKYSIPFVHRFQLFEMPVLGYAGYLPFGIECVVIGDLLQRAVGSFRTGRTGAKGRRMAR